MRNANFLAQRQNPFQESVEAALDAKIGRGPLYILFNFAAIGLHHIGHHNAVEQPVVGIIEPAKWM